MNNLLISLFSALKYKGNSSDNSPFIFLGIIGAFFLIYAIFCIVSKIKDKIWVQPHNKIESLENDIKKLQNIHKEKIESFYKQFNNTDQKTSVDIAKKLLADTISCYALKEIFELCNKEYAFLDIPQFYSYRINKENATKFLCNRFEEAIEEQYKYRYLLFLYPELAKIFDGKNINITLPSDDLKKSINNNVYDIVNILSKNNTNITKEMLLMKNRISFLEAAQSNLTAIPYMSKIMADYETYGLENLAKELDWGFSFQRLSKVKSIREIRKDAQNMVEKNKESQYQLAYLLELFPNLQDVIETEYKQLPQIQVKELTEYDAARDYLSKEEYLSLSVTERNQLALDRYRKSHNKSKWQIGRDYELYIGYKYSLKGYKVDYFGSYMGIKDLGRDLICKKGDQTIIIQCKYWSSVKQIHEKHITQLYGTMISYCIEHHCNAKDINGVLITNITLSDMAKKMAKFLNIKYKENVMLDDYPCIKCNIGHSPDGTTTKIYHLPFDQQYDATKIDKKGEFFAMTVEEAEKAGFRRAYKWFGSN